MTTSTHTLGRGTLALAAPLLAAFFFGGCTVTTNDNPTAPDHCDQDTGVVCPSPSLGYSCTGDALPTDTDGSIRCGDGIENDGVVSYCCAPPDSCEFDPTITSCGSSTPYTCSGGQLPTDTDPSLDCGPPASGPDGTLAYCCDVTAGSDAGCDIDTTITSCGDLATGYRCTGGLTPVDTDDSLECGDGADGGDGTEAFCCIDFTSNTCSPDPDVVGCANGSYGFSCTSTVSPEHDDPSLECSDPIDGKDGKTLYCCTQ